MHAASNGKVALTFAVYKGDALVARDALTENIVKIGSDPRSHLRLDAASASRMHAVVEVTSPSDITLIDLGHEPATLVNDRRVDKCKLHTGDRIRIGETMLCLESARATNSSVPPSVFAANPFAPFATTVLAAAAAPMTGLETGAVPEATREIRSPDVDDLTTEAIEVRVLWGDSVLRVAHVTSGQSFALDETGEGDKSFSVPPEVLGAARLTLVALRAGAATLLVPPRAGVMLHAKDARWQTLSDLLASGAAQASAEVPGAHEIELPPNARATVRLAGSELAFEVARVPSAKRVPAGALASFDPASYAYTGLSALLHVALVASFAFFMPAMNADASEDIDRAQVAAMMPYLNAIAEREPDPPAEQTGETSSATTGGTGSRAPGEEGAAGTLLAKPANARFAVQGPEDNPDPHVARERALHEIATTGMVGLIATDMGADPHAPVNPWSTHDDAQGRDPKSALGNMWGDEIGDSFGFGVGLSGTGQGGGCEGGSCQGIGLGNVNTIGHGDGLKDGQGFGPGGWGISHGPLKGGHVAKAPPLPREGKIDVGGHLPAEVIQRIVRQNFGRFRMCYETGLRTNPNLQGRVAIKFIIDHDGAVSLAADAGSDLPDRDVVSCIVRGFNNLSFPQPQGGIVKVVYPFQLVPGE